MGSVFQIFFILFCSLVAVIWAQDLLVGAIVDITRAPETAIIADSSRILDQHNNLS